MIKSLVWIAISSILVGSFATAVQGTVVSHDFITKNLVLVDSFKGIAANGYDWSHIFLNHSPSGDVAKQRLKADSEYVYSIYQNMTDNQIKACVQRAWKSREKIEIQAAAPGKSRRIKYRGYDEDTKYTLEIWQNEDTGFIETAYPVKTKKP